MANVLPTDIKKQTQKEYSLRFWSLVLVLVMLLAIFAGVLLIPSYLVSLTEESGKIEQIKLIKASSSLREDDKREEIFELTEAELNLVKAQVEDVSLEKLINEVLFAKREAGGISVINISYNTQKEKNSIVSVRGIAKTRADLLRFTKELENRPIFGEIALPVSSLKNDTNLTFSLTSEVIN